MKEINVVDVVEIQCIHPDYCPTYRQVTELLGGINLHNCKFELVFKFDQKQLEWTGECRCTGRNTIPKCKKCQRGRSTRTQHQINAYIADKMKASQRWFNQILRDVKHFFLTCNDFSFFLSSSSMLLRHFQDVFGGRKTKVLPNNEDILEKFMTCFKENRLSKAGQNICLITSKILPHVRTRTRFGSICPDFSIRSELLALSITMKMVYRFASLCHLNNNRDRQKVLMRQIADYICSMHFRRKFRS